MCLKQYEKEVVQYQLDQEKAVLKRLERQYTQALQDITHKINTLSSTIEMLQNAGNSDEFALSQARSKAYQRDYQEALKGQISGVLDKLHADEFETVQDYLNACYEDGFTGAMYQMHAQDVPIIVPIDQGAEVQAIQLETKLKNPLYEALAGGMDGMKKAIQSELTRGIAMGLGWDEIARNLSNTTKAPLAHAKTIARTEGHRIQEKAAYDAFQKAKSRGADVLKQWDSTLDGKTRDSHRRVDGELREDGKKFSNGLLYPGDPDGEAEEVVNCRCTMLPRARWALDEDELKTLQERAKYFGLDKKEQFADFKKNYLKAAESLENTGKSGIIEAKYKAMLEARIVVRNSDLPNGLPIESTPNSITDKTDEEGQVLQRRVYGDNGKAIADFDTNDHGLHKQHPTGAHKNVFNYNKKNPHGRPLPLTEQELINNADIIQKGKNYRDE